jgi:serine/threonine protein phosphatase PrpC
MLGSKIYIVNVGDSRAVLARQKSFITNTLPEYIVEQLTIDHKPDVPAEMDRIIAYGGYVRPGRCGGPSRVYLDEDLTMIGLATSRTIGSNSKICKNHFVRTYHKKHRRLNCKRCRSNSKA